MTSSTMKKIDYGLRTRQNENYCGGVIKLSDLQIAVRGRLRVGVFRTEHALQSEGRLRRREEKHVVFIQ